HAPCFLRVRVRHNKRCEVVEHADLEAEPPLDRAQASIESDALGLGRAEWSTPAPPNGSAPPGEVLVLAPVQTLGDEQFLVLREESDRPMFRQGQRDARRVTADAR